MRDPKGGPAHNGWTCAPTSSSLPSLFDEEEDLRARCSLCAMRRSRRPPSMTSSPSFCLRLKEFARRTALLLPASMGAADATADAAGVSPLTAPRRPKELERRTLAATARLFCGVACSPLVGGEAAAPPS
eukprot:CAMPEP_0181208684 /NCGR_PEP_ID=MMETSP1096-20121128/22253_1 /TAXON_ID=156174 ORGANISM="Chrysochromulina ericina, Strain CCMP281" /NCGR_SAMPLE_ID=MMETSP1096 /ASSEMBLY_ACC=CAM_ASM_000453 /LENGTH=129 /DNA_ID=CAMNT_0023299773 /DNA_START=449 /DNA_END=838 /DNA_ORIENTATION=-